MDQQRQFRDADTACWAETAKMPEMLLGSSVQILLMRLIAQVDSSIDLTRFCWQDASCELKAQQCDVL
jgi:hypothetical protein